MARKKKAPEDPGEIGDADIDGRNFDFGEGMGMADSFLPTDFEMPDFSQIGKTLKMIEWIPALITTIVVLSITFLAQVVYYGLGTTWDYNITYQSFMWIIFISLFTGLISGAFVKMFVGKKAKKNMSL